MLDLIDLFVCGDLALGYILGEMEAPRVPGGAAQPRGQGRGQEETAAGLQDLPQGTLASGLGRGLGSRRAVHESNAAMWY